VASRCQCDCPIEEISEGAGTSLHIQSLIARYFLEHLPPGGRKGGDQ
jgi:hypothetical protein